MSRTRRTRSLPRPRDTQTQLIRLWAALPDHNRRRVIDVLGRLVAERLRLRPPKGVGNEPG